ncbi:LysR family transcriptional regulator [Photobacterium lipolyticum]|uniref:LysR family transcriptional regulator n=1 Tax=Photobacterium lipolyticum TaxID=266810 RepID=A0A2T3N3A6_9GAMM|nr:LysR family transcriptional regulator [Photobacterium lipolyticum]PSW06764.1 LysR family transcriptional regulator [Photobacterium lipolyticum]
MDKIDAMQAFAAVVQEGSFSKAAERLKLSPQLVSKYVSQLESHLQTRLLNRTTRRVSTTEAGLAYFERCQQVLIDIEEMENSLGALHQQASGTLRISAPMSFGMHHLSKALVDFQKQCPLVEVDLQLTDRKVDIVEDGIDIALRIGELKSSSLIAKKIAPIRLVICASPDYLKSNGTPNNPRDLTDHCFLRYSYTDSSTSFSQFNLKASEIKFKSHFVANNGDVLVNAAVQGGGITIQPTFITGKPISKGKLTTILEEYEPAPLGLYVVYAHRHHLASKVRCFIDFISDYFGSPPYWDQY